MSFWQQLNELLSETPGNLVYHLVTLFAIQATLAIAVAHWRRERAPDALTRRLAIGAAGLLLVRVVFLAVSLWLLSRDDHLLAMRLLPPLEQAINTLTALVVVWIVTPRLERMPRLQDALAVLVLLLVAVVYVYFAQSYVPAEGATYNASPQSYFWGLLQLALLGLGALWIAVRRFPSGGLRFFPVLLLFIGHLMQVWDFPERFQSNTEIPFWIRFGHLASFPLLAVLAYRHTMQQLLGARLENRPALEQLSETLRQAARVLEPDELGETLRAVVRMVYGVVQPAVAGVALNDPERPALLQVVATQGDEALHWELNGDSWPAFRLTMEQRQAVELLPNGLGARQLHSLYEELGVRNAAALLLVPMLVNEETAVGVLFAGAHPDETVLQAEKRSALPVLATYFAQLVARRQRTGAALLPPLPMPAMPAPEVVSAAEAERDEARAQAEQLRDRLDEAESRLFAAQQQARDLAATVEALESRTVDPRVPVLEEEIASLREALHEAEDAMTAVAEGELNAEWVTMTISRYSGELEEAQTRIAELEIQLAQREPEQARALMTALAQELRTPLTSIGGYTDLLLGETQGILGTRQRDFLERVRANVERTGLLLEQIVQVAAAPAGRRYLSGVEQVHLQDLVEVAVNTVMMQMRRKSLRLYLDIPADLPAFPANRDAFGQALIHLLSNASQASLNDGAITIRAQVDTYHRPGENGHGRREDFLQLSVRDSGEGIPPGELSRVFDLQHRADNLLVPGLGDTGAGLQVAHTLVDAHGGRMWVDSEEGVGSTFTVVMPLGENGAIQTGEKPGETGTEQLQVGA
jgi:signal transduction histidine kinase